MDLRNKSVLVTGGASGLGAACVRLLTQSGAKATVLDLNEEAGAALVKEVGESARYVQANVTQEADIQAAIKEAVDHFGGLHRSEEHHV